MKSEIEIKIENTMTHKIIAFISCLLWITFISWSYFGTQVVNYKITILYIVGMLVAVWWLLKNLLVLVYVRGTNIEYQSAFVPCIYIHTNFRNINRVKISRRTTNEASGEPYDVMTFYGEKGKMFSVPMMARNSKKLYQAAASYYGIRMEDLRKIKSK